MACWLFVALVVLAVTFICLLLCFACELFGVGEYVVPSSLAALRACILVFGVSCPGCLFVYCLLCVMGFNSVGLHSSLCL